VNAMLVGADQRGRFRRRPLGPFGSTSRTSTSTLAEEGRLLLRSSGICEDDVAEHHQIDERT